MGRAGHRSPPEAADRCGGVRNSDARPDRGSRLCETLDETPSRGRLTNHDAAAPDLVGDGDSDHDFTTAPFP